MGNLDTIKAVEDNITAILLAQNINVEDSFTNETIETDPLAVIKFTGETFGYSNGQKPLYNELRYDVAIRFSDKAPSTSRDRAADYAHRLRDGITVNALNVAALAASKLVSWVSHDGYDVTYTPPVTQIDYRLTVRYREI